MEKDTINKAFVVGIASMYFRIKYRIRDNCNNFNNGTLYQYAVRKQTLAEIAADSNLNVKTIHRKVTSALQESFNSIDGQNGVERVIRRFYDIPIQTCQAHKITTINHYLLKYPRQESYRELKRITHSVIRGDILPFETESKSS